MKKVKKANAYQIKPIKKAKKTDSFLKQMIGFRPRIAMLALIAIAVIIAIYYTFRTEAATAWPLKVSSNGHYLVDQNNKAYLYTADTSWYMISHLTVADAKKVIDTRKAQGFNAIQTLIPGWGMKTKIGPRGQAFTNHNITTPNEAFFKGMDEIAAHAKSQDMVLFLGPMDVQDLKTYSNEDIKTYGTWLVNRYKGSGNILWYVGSDDGPDDGIDKMRVLAQAMKAADPNALISSHFFGLAKPFFLGGEGWYGFYGYQWNGNTRSGNKEPWCYEIAYEGYTTTPTKPFLNLEPAYDPDAADGTKTTPQQVRRCAWGSILSGSLGIAYGGPRDAWAIGNPNLNWSALDRPAAAHVGNVNKIMSQFSWEKLVPDMDSKVITGGRGSKGDGDFATAAAANDGSLIVVYMPKGQKITVDMSKLSGTANAYWFDPTNAAKTDAGTNLANTGTKDFTPPSTNASGEKDFTLVLTTGTPGISQPVTSPPYVCLGPCVPSVSPPISIEPSSAQPIPSGKPTTAPTYPNNPNTPSIIPSIQPNPNDGNNNNQVRKGLLEIILGFFLTILEFILSLFK